MCGIYGTTIFYNQKQVQKKLERTAFRGPDYMGITTLDAKPNPLIFGHNRLSIIDLDERSNQPFSYHDLTIVFNGEIFNFQDIRKQLEQKNYVFKTTSDTEVICAAYLEYGKKCVSLFNGMFAFVLYDPKQNILFGAIDRLGQKPFYYYHNGLAFEFASQLSSIQMFNPALSISSSAIQQYFSWNYIPASQTIFNEVNKLEGGHIFTYALGSGQLNIEPYWDIPYTAPQDTTLSFDQAKQELKELLVDATKIRLFADVPVGVFLSGGVDSSLISALATQTTAEKIKTFSIKFSHDRFDESSYAEKVAKHLKTDQHTILCDVKEGLGLIDNFTHYYDEPFADSSAIPSMLLAKHTKKHVTVALSGDAGDELFLGYHRYDWLRIINYFMKMPTGLRKLTANSLLCIPNYKANVVGKVISNPNIEKAYLTTVYDKNPVYLNRVIEQHIPQQIYLDHKNKDIFQKAGDFDLKTYLPFDINTKVDRATMAFSLEARSPLLDYRVVEYAQKLPTNFKYQKGNQKRILKEILYDHVPKAIFDRPKSGFAIPFQEWFKDELKTYVYDSLNESQLNKIPNINKNVVLNKIENHMQSKENNYSLIWKLIILKQWLDKNGKAFSIT
ncbi:asparagine synthase (glutamine-hydrolyzing) [Croceivirga radicis]|uniref:asparagine synthase (glutamine-hydrolyzing) n=1 Tax=Croceivirga radicis TaxID=1929488 RepID=A0A1V6LSC1_9FLAO|nr:asparagine synthase (glutamine-hydrolyzing) [Croceivirga radicis]OQD43083.1 asparagine synthase (glutamine-hydrolyzing) [Croceivirga radicis]